MDFTYLLIIGLAGFQSAYVQSSSLLPSESFSLEMNNATDVTAMLTATPTAMLTAMTTNAVAATTTQGGEIGIATTTAINPTVSATSVPAASSCVATNSTVCDKSSCCKKDNTGAWTGVDSAKNLQYNETTCSNGSGNAVPIVRETPCSVACNNNECDVSGANNLIFHLSTILFSFFAYWLATTL